MVTPQPTAPDRLDRIPGLDDVLAGGPTPLRVYLVQGIPASGRRHSGRSSCSEGRGTESRASASRFRVQTEDRNRALAADFDVYLPKPADLANLQTVLGRQRLQEPATCARSD